jgi:hypothetical protein
MDNQSLALSALKRQMCWIRQSEKRATEACCYDTTLIFLEYQIVAMGRRSMNVDVAVMRCYRPYRKYLRYSL